MQNHFTALKGAKLAEGPGSPVSGSDDSSPPRAEQKRKGKAKKDKSKKEKRRKKRHRDKVSIFRRARNKTN